MGGLIVYDQELTAPFGLQVLNFRTGGQFRFINQRRMTIVDELVLHETVTSSAKATLDVIQQRNLGVHLIVGSDGIVYQHGDLRTDLLWHAGEHNPRSVGIEIVSPYYPDGMPRNGAWSRVINAKWAHRGKYVVPPPEQAEVVSELVDWLTSGEAKGLSIPKTWVGLSDQRMCMVRTPKSALGPGIYAHMFFGHADGAWFSLYTWLRLVAGLRAETAYEAAIYLAEEAGTSVDLSAYFPPNFYLP